MQVIVLLILLIVLALGSGAALMGSAVQWWMVTLFALVISLPILALQTRLGGAFRAIRGMGLIMLVMTAGYLIMRLLKTGHL